MRKISNTGLLILVGVVVWTVAYMAYDFVRFVDTGNGKYLGLGIVNVCCFLLLLVIYNDVLRSNK